MPGEPKPPVQHRAGHFCQHSCFSCRKGGKGSVWKRDFCRHWLIQGVGMEKVRLRSGGFNQLIQRPTEQKEHQRDVPLYFSAQVWLSLIGSLKTRVLIQEWGCKKQNAIGEINVWCKKIAPLFMPHETLLALSFGCRAGDWPSSWVISPSLLPELSLPWWSAHPSSTSYFSPPFPSHAF